MKLVVVCVLAVLGLLVWSLTGRISGPGVAVLKDVALEPVGPAPQGEESSTTVLVATTTTAPPAPVTTVTTELPTVQPAPKPDRIETPPVVSDDDIWWKLAMCESGRDGQPRWTFNGLHQGGLQYAPGTWDSYRPDDYPAEAYDATPQQQIDVGRLVLAAQGPGAWPTCGPRVGLRRGM